jgi:PBP1b-binding outer membrane lipoprotein LpoB
MVSFKKIGIIAILLIALTFSGCVGDQAADDEVEVDTEAPTADEILAEEGVGLTDSEIEDLESDLDELEATLSELDEDENLTIEEV